MTGHKDSGLIQRLARAFVGIVFTGVVGLVAAYGTGPERFWLTGLAQYVPYPAYILTSLAAVGCSLALGRPFRIAAWLSLLLVLTVVMGLELKGSEIGVERVRVMTYNIKDYLAARRASGLAEIGREIDAHDPDIVVLQDARELADEDSRKEAQRVLGPRQIFSFGQYVVASRFPLRDCAKGDMPFRQETHTYVTCVVIAHGIEFDLVTAHFITPRSALSAVRENPLRAIAEWKENVEDRMTQAEKLATDMRSRTRPLIVAGDFNAPDTSLVVRTLFNLGLRDAFDVAGRGYGYTWGHSLRFRFSFLRIDHILVSPEFAVADCFVGGSAGSEHRPVIADLYLTRDN